MKNSTKIKIAKFNIIASLVITLYCLVVFADLPLLAEARDLWIETAMTTADHQWLATLFFPDKLIDGIMSRQIVTGEGVISNPALFYTGVGADNEADFGADNKADFGVDIESGSGTNYKTDVGSNNKTDIGIDNEADLGADDETDFGVNGVSRGSAPDINAEGSGEAGAEAQNSPSGTPVEDPPEGSRGWFFYDAPRGADNTVRNNSRTPYIISSVPDMSFFSAPDFSDSEDNTPYKPAGSPFRLPSVGTLDEFGNRVIVSDTDEEIVIVEIKKTGYTGRLLFVPDPSRVVVRNTKKKEVQGEFVKSYLSEYGAIAGMNGNGFDDPDGRGKGGVIIGWSVADGAAWGQGPKSEYASVGFNDQDVLVVGAIKDFAAYNIRDLAQYGPTLIADGKKLISGSGGWGLQPRSAIGQRDDGAVLMATFDGRQPGHSLGITAGEIADILFSYGCVNAGLCDGGSSSIMMYDGAIIGKPSTPMKDTGRYLPNAFLVLGKT